VKRDSQEYLKLRRVIENQSGEVQASVDRFLDETRKYVDYGLIASKVAKKDLSFIKEPVQVLNVDKMLKDSKSEVLKLDSAVDVFSLH